MLSHVNLRQATVLYGLGFLIHNADHARRGIDASPEPVVWAGTAVAMLTAAIFTIVVVRHHIAARFCAAAGAAIAVGVALAHLLPKWGFLSDPLPGGDVDVYTWAAVLAEILAAAWLSLIGLRAMRQTRTVASQTARL